MQPTTLLTGNEHEVCFNGVTIPCSIIQEIGISIAQDTTDIRSLCGISYVKRSVPSVEVSLTLIHRNMELLSVLLPGLYNDGATAGTDCGGLRIASNTCETETTVTAPLNIHPICQEDACQDITLWNADPVLNFDYSVTETGDETITITFKSLPAPATLADGTANPRVGEIFWYGTPGLADGVTWDCTVGDFTTP